MRSRGSRFRGFFFSCLVPFAVCWLRTRQRLLSHLAIEEVRHHAVGFLGLRQVPIVPESVRQTVEYDQLRIDSSLQKNPMQVNRVTEQQIALAGEKQGRWKALQVGINRREHWIRCVGGADV